MSSLIESTPVLVTGSLAEAGTSLDDLGGKGANLGRLAAAGFPVPDGFVITTAAYHSQVAGLDLTAEPADLRARIEAVPIEPALADRIRQAYDRLGGGPVAVRSSATAEDLPGAAFAGQQDTYLDVDRDDLLGAVARCWASLWTDRAVAYRRRLGITPDEVAIAVVVQAMVPAELAGVMFTADPVTGDRDRFMIDAVSGLGEALVSGDVTPDHYLVDPTGGRLEFRSGGDGEPLLDAGRLARLAELGAAVRDLFGGPQDLEWAIADGKIRLLQARPMTALPEPVRATRAQRFAVSVATEYFTERPYPLDSTTWLPYGPAGMMLNLIKAQGLDVELADLLPETDGVVVQFRPPTPRPTPRLLIALPQLLMRMNRFDPRRWRQDPRVSQFERRLADLAGDPAALSWRDLLRRPRDLFRVAELGESLRADFLPGIGLALLRLRFRLALIRETKLLGALMAGAETVTSIMNSRLADLARSVRQRPEAARLFADLSTADLLVRLRTDPALADLAADFERLLSDYGHRETSSPVLVSPPTWIDAPEVPLGMLQALVANRSTAAPASRSAEAEQIVYAKRSLADPRRREAMRRAIEAAQAGMAFREDSHDLLTRPAPVLRRCLLEIGRRLHEAGVLPEPFDVFHLRLEELERLDEPSRLAEAERDRLARLVRQRAISRDRLASVPMINRGATFAAGADAGDALVTGMPAGAGVATGPARVITTPAEFATMRPGEVLVCPYTNPSWTPLFQSAVAVVADTGGVGSHAAIVAREYGLPAVMGTGDGTRRLRTGQRIRVDGSTGTVTAAEDGV
ncbi:PEP/pyruvate-binding domain-containing protein [Microlunatus parietis]|uniref:Pyruvate,water dikinase n=1 Tax=Microlunatus parietis TaxID=682979 RepID=A0A7Y9L9C3_9ACTN|nr:PEP/pyruvate-binding domain-containing protein [Microlunatus parietis]NYE71639.1 pyruvate,water dikinase [Microlunatus parietis]